MRRKSWSILPYAFLAVGLSSGCQSGPEPRSIEKASVTATITPVLSALRAVPVRKAIARSFESRHRTLGLILGSLGKEAEAMDTPPAQEPTSGQHAPEAGESEVSHAAEVSLDTPPELKSAVEARHEAPETSVTSAPATVSEPAAASEPVAPPADPKPPPSEPPTTPRSAAFADAGGVVLGFIVVFFLGLVTRWFDRPTALAMVYCALVFAGGSCGDFPLVEKCVATAVSFVLGLGLFWILHKARRSNPWWAFFVVFGPVAIEAVWVLPGILAG